MAAYSTMGLIWRRSGYGRGVSKLVCGRGGGGNCVSRSFSSVGSVTTEHRMFPWLMLPPATEDGSMVYKFFSLAENRLLSFNWSNGAEDCSDFDPNDKDAKLVGSSKGWLCLMNNQTRQMDLINPLTRRHVKLPSLHPLEDNTKPSGRVSPFKIILSRSPDDNEGGEECRALILYEDNIALEDLRAFCCPGRSDAKWTRIRSESRCFHWFAYSRRQKLFYCAGHMDLEAWDLRDPLSPKMSTTEFLEIEEGDSSGALLGSNVREFYFLVINEDTDDLFLVSCFFKREDDGDLDYNKMIFDVNRYDSESETLRYMICS